MEKIFDLLSKIDPKHPRQIGRSAEVLIELAAMGVPVMPGFVIELDAELLQNKPKFRKQLAAAVKFLEQTTDRSLSSSKSPLLLSTTLSYGLLDSQEKRIEFVGLNAKIIEALSDTSDIDGVCARFSKWIEEFAILSLGKDPSDLEQERKKHADSNHAYREALLQTMKKGFPPDSMRQLETILFSLIQLHQAHSSGMPAAIIVQVMPMRALADRDYLYEKNTRDPLSGDKTDLSAPGKSSGQVTLSDKEVHALTDIAQKLECCFKEVCSFGVSMENDSPTLITYDVLSQRTIQAKFRLLAEHFQSGCLTAEQYLLATSIPELKSALLPTMDIESSQDLPQVSSGMRGAPGAALGRVFFSTEALTQAYWNNHSAGIKEGLILVKRSTYADDVQAVEIGQGVITRDGGYSSHAPVIARCLGKPSILIPEMEFIDNHVMIGAFRLNEGDLITMDVNSETTAPTLYLGEAALVPVDINNTDLQFFIKTAKEYITDFPVLANAENPRDIETACLLGADGIGLCRTEHMFFQPDRIQLFRNLIIADLESERQAALDLIQPFMEEDFSALFRLMNGDPLTIRLLDAPLHEFIPESTVDLKETINWMIAHHPNLTEQHVTQKFNRLKEVNPMLGHRGCRVGVSFPEIYEMQIRAILNAAIRVKKEEKKDVAPKILIPFVISRDEVSILKKGKKGAGKQFKGLNGIIAEVEKTHQLSRLPFEVKTGVMIELPAAALNAKDLAIHADFFSIGSNDLTQTMLGISRDDINSFLPAYTEGDIFNDDPFQKLDPAVKQAIQYAVTGGTQTRPDLDISICGEHTTAEEDIAFYLDNNITISSSPLNIPIVILHIAHRAIARQ